MTQVSTRGILRGAAVGCAVAVAAGFGSVSLAQDAANDADAPEVHEYRAPGSLDNLDALEIHTLRRRVSALEERIERLESVLAAQRDAMRAEEN